MICIVLVVLLCGWIQLGREFIWVAIYVLCFYAYPRQLIKIFPMSRRMRDPFLQTSMIRSNRVDCSTEVYRVHDVLTDDFQSIGNEELVSPDLLVRQQ